MKLLATLAVAGALSAVPTAVAGAPTIVPAPATSFTDPSTCGFAVDIAFATNGQTAKIFSDGRLMFTGPLKATFSANGKTLLFNIPGPATISGESAVGHGLGAGPTLLPDGTITLALTAGVADITGEPAVLLHGHVLTDICAALA